MALVVALGACGSRTKKVKLPPPIKPRIGWTQVGIASWYGHPYHGRQAANGEIYDMNQMTAAHKRLPFETWLEVRNLSNGRKTQVRITDRGPFVGKRIIDLSRAAATEIGMIATGTAKVRIKRIRPPTGPSPRGTVSSQRASRGTVSIQRTSRRFDIQLGAFSKRSSAKALAKRVRGNGYRVSISRSRSGGRVLYQVVALGGRQPEASARLEQLRNQGFDGFLRPRGG